MAVTPMRFLSVLVLPTLIVAAAVFFAYPPLKEEANGECSALEQRVRDDASHDNAGFLIVGRLYGSSSSEPSDEAYARNRHPMLPAAVGCAVEYWRAAISPPAPARPGDVPTAPPSPSPPAESETAPPTSILSRGITPNGDPISPATVFSLPMNSVAVRVDYHGRAGAALRFQLIQGKTVLATCPAERSDGLAWCKFDVELRKGIYSIGLIADRALIGQFPFTVIGR